MVEVLTCVVPIRNEAGNILSLIPEIRSIKEISEVIIVEGGSTDDSFEIAQALSKKDPCIKVLRQKGKGKFDAVLDGLHHARNERIIIWDADGTISREDTIELIRLSLKSERMVTGDRLRGKREKSSMRPLNLVGNYFFASLFALLFRRRTFDTLCGTKIFPKRILNSVPAEVLESDPFGDFSILIGAFLSQIPIDSIPTRYYARRYGSTNIRRWRGGILLLKIYIRSIPACRNLRKVIHEEKNSR